MRQNKDTLLRGRDSWHLQEIPIAKPEDGCHKGVFVEVGRAVCTDPPEGGQFHISQTYATNCSVVQG